MRVLLIEDNAEIADAVQLMLVRQRFAVDVAPDGETGFDYLLRGTYDLAIVDLVLPKRDGFTICAEARTEGVATPLLILTARDAVEDRIRGLDCGADDYLIKPFAEAELAARMRALLRRAKQPIAASDVRIGTLALNGLARSAAVAGRPLHLGAKEFTLLEYLVQNAGTALSRQQILEKVWDYDYEGSSNIVDVYVGMLRRKLKALACTAVIHTVWGIGYRLDARSSTTEP